MADENAVEANGVSGEEDPPTLETIDLDSSALEREETGQEKAPVLSFKGDEDDEEEDSDQDDSSKKGGAAAGGEGGAYKGGFVAGPEGTRQHKKQTRSISETTSSIKDWSITHIKMTRQVLSEQFGRATKTVDPDLEARVAAIRDTQKKYNDLMSLMGQLRFHMESVLNTQTSLAEQFGFLSVRCPELHTEFTFNSITQKRLVHNGKKLMAAINYFIANVYTVSSKAIEDTLLTAKTYESVRILHDAYRTDLEAAQKTASANQSASAAAKVTALQEQYDKHRVRYDQLRKDLDIKLKLLDENRLKVMQKQLVLLNSGFAAYFSGCNETMETIIEEFRGRLQDNAFTNDPPAWLEELSEAQQQQQQQQRSNSKSTTRKQLNSC